ncbi:inositol hexakisphosphate kinase 3 isoform X5 [Bombina bombina]|uniref:inositol hexakisphosphate kinase 3 isoform X5 n=1 Tax=Bombina bombina TaxID=8345 RepID=UPI00235A6255|nr:inositol hexakisphosphate kinase 3 isoform X5 [Bombina bombina]
MRGRARAVPRILGGVSINIRGNIEEINVILRMGLQEGMEPENSIPLLPLCHQVGGHASMLCYDNDTICKPLVSQEQRFYETLPREMRDFTPRYKGMIFVSLQRDSGGNLSLIANPDACSQFDAPGDTSVALWRKVRWRRRSLGPEQGGMIIKQSQANTANINSSTESSYRTESCFHSGITYQVRSSRFSPADQDLYNPWGLHCHRRHLSQMSLEFNKNQQHRYLLLENVASKFSLPCILDLKMGIRQHGDDASDEKKARHMEKCAKSTSASLGVRICGMQVYQADVGQYLWRDKYYGRKLSIEGFRNALYQYLHNGYLLRNDLLEPIISQLKSLRSVIEGQGSYRFYSSSILIVYDGEGTTRKNDHSFLQNKLASSECQGMNSGKVDVKMIDFAHTIFKGSRNCPAMYEGPDQGYIFGLENLINILQSMTGDHLH